MHLNRFDRARQAWTTYDWQAWLYHGKTSWLQLAWFLVLLGVLAFLDQSTQIVWLVPPFAATLTILLLLPRSPIAQPFTVVIGSTLGALAGTVASLFVHGPIYAALVASVMVLVLPLLKVYHPPGVALSLYPLLLHTSLAFPFVVVLPFTLVSVITCAGLSRIFKTWPEYPLPIKRTGS